VAPETVANVPYRFNEGVAGVLNLASETPDVDIYRPVAAKVIIAPDLAQQSIASIDPTRMTGQESEQLVFFEGKRHEPAVQGNLAPGEVEHQVAAFD